MASGLVTAASSYAALSLVGAALSLVVVLVALRPDARHRQVSARMPQTPVEEPEPAG
jgi:hypothetical protein